VTADEYGKIWRKSLEVEGSDDRMRTLENYYIVIFASVVSWFSSKKIDLLISINSTDQHFSPLDVEYSSKTLFQVLSVVCFKRTQQYSNIIAKSFCWKANAS
jgi:hypothetical protein